MSTLVPSSPSTKTPMDTAIELACNACFHRSLTLPATASHEALKVTFATTSNFERGDGDGDDALPVMLFCGPMGGTRYMLMDIDHVANEAGVRIVFIDRYAPLRTMLSLWQKESCKGVEGDHVRVMTEDEGGIILRMTDILQTRLWGINFGTTGPTNKRLDRNRTCRPREIESSTCGPCLA